MVSLYRLEGLGFVIKGLWFSQGEGYSGSTKGGHRSPPCS